MKKLLFLFAVLLTSVGAWAQTKQYLQDVEVSASNGTGVEASKWSKTWTSNNSLLTLSVGASNMTIEDGVLALYRGSNANATYTLSVPDNHRIISYSFDYVLTGKETGTLKLKVGQTEYTPSDQTQNISVNDINAQTATFQLLAVNNGIKVTNFTVRVESAVAFSYVYKKDESIIKEDMYHLYKDTEYPAVPYSYVTPTGTPTGNVSYEDEGKSYEITVEYSLPFAVSESYQNAKWYYMTIHSADRRNVQSAETYPYNNSAKPNSSYYSQWAFVGNPIEGISIYNRAFEGKTLGFDATSDGSPVYMKDGIHKWTVDKGDGGFALRQGANQYINDYRQQLKIWNAGSSNKNSDGNEFNVVPVDGLFYQSWGNHYPWSNAEVVPVPDGLQVCGYDGDAQGHVLRKAETKINATGDNISVTFTYSSGTDMLMIAGVDLVANGNVVKFDYHEGKAGGDHSNNTYTLADVPAGDYTLRYFVCDMPSGEDKHDLTKTGGQIKVVGANRMPIEVVYNYMLDGQIRATENFDNVPFGGYYPDIKYDEIPYGIAAPIKPSGLLDEPVIMDGVVTVTVELQHNLPFERSASATDNPKWYIVDMHSNDTGNANILGGVKKYIWTYDPNASEPRYNVYLPQEYSVQSSLFGDDKMWCFVGNAYDGFKIYNKLAGPSLTLNKPSNGNTDAFMSSETPTLFTVHEGGIDGAICFKPVGHTYYLNTQAPPNGEKYLRGWDQADGGSSCRMFAPTDFVKAKILSFPEISNPSFPERAVTRSREMTPEVIGFLTETLESLGVDGWNTSVVDEELTVLLDLLEDNRVTLTDGGYYYIKGTGTNGKTSSYAVNEGDNFRAKTAENVDLTPQNIWRFAKVKNEDAFKFQSYSNGQYVQLTAANNNNYESPITLSNNDASKFTFSYNSLGQFTIKDGNKPLRHEGSKKNYAINSWNGEVATWYIIEVPELPLAMHSTGLSTFSASADLEIPGGVTAYYASETLEDEGLQIRLLSLNGVIPANTGVVVKADGGTTVNFPVTTGATPLRTNYLKANLETKAVTPEPDNSVFILATPAGKETGFYPLSSTTNTINWYKSYLEIPTPTSSTARIGILWDDNATYIENVGEDNANTTAIYNLAGQKMTKVQKGINIINGKLVIK